MNKGKSVYLNMQTGNVWPIDILGMDCDDPAALERLLLQQEKLLHKADIICGSKATLAILRHDPELAWRVLPLTPPLEPIYDCLAGLRREGLRVVVLADGDPLFYGIGASLARYMDPAAIRIHPAISCLQAACARLSLPWHNVFCLSLHGREDFAPLFSAVGREQPICVLTSARFGPDVLARVLLDRGVDCLDVHVFERMGKEGESVKSMGLEECADTIFDDFSTVILNPRAKSRYPAPGIDNDGLLGSCRSKRPVRGAALELLRIYPRDTVWDVGSGSGLLALEACSLAHAGKVIAIEEQPERAFDIQINRSREGAVNLAIVLGHAPDCLQHLETPQRIFIGGGISGADGQALLAHCASALAPGGRLVASCILLDSISICRKFLEDLGWPMEMLQIQASTLESLGHGERLSPLNPVFLLAAHKP